MSNSSAGRKSSQDNTPVTSEPFAPIIEDDEANHSDSSGDSGGNSSGDSSSDPILGYYANLAASGEPCSSQIELHKPLPHTPEGARYVLEKGDNSKGVYLSPPPASTTTTPSLSNRTTPSTSTRPTPLSMPSPMPNGGKAAHQRRATLNLDPREIATATTTTHTTNTTPLLLSNNTIIQLMPIPADNLRRQITQDSDDYSSAQEPSQIGQTGEYAPLNDGATAAAIDALRGEINPSTAAPKGSAPSTPAQEMSESATYTGLPPALAPIELGGFGDSTPIPVSRTSPASSVSASPTINGNDSRKKLLEEQKKQTEIDVRVEIADVPGQTNAVHLSLKLRFYKWCLDKSLTIQNPWLIFAAMTALSNALQAMMGPSGKATKEIATGWWDEMAGKRWIFMGIPLGSQRAGSVWSFIASFVVNTALSKDFIPKAKDDAWESMKAFYSLVRIKFAGWSRWSKLKKLKGFLNGYSIIAGLCAAVSATMINIDSISWLAPWSEGIASGMLWTGGGLIAWNSYLAATRLFKLNRPLAFGISLGLGILGATLLAATVPASSLYLVATTATSFYTFASYFALRAKGQKNFFQRILDFFNKDQRLKNEVIADLYRVNTHAQLRTRLNAKLKGKQLTEDTVTEFVCDMYRDKSFDEGYTKTWWDYTKIGAKWTIYSGVAVSAALVFPTFFDKFVKGIRLAARAPSIVDFSMAGKYVTYFFATIAGLGSTSLYLTNGCDNIYWTSQIAYNIVHQSKNKIRDTVTYLTSELLVNLPAAQSMLSITSDVNNNPDFFAKDTFPIGSWQSNWFCNNGLVGADLTNGTSLKKYLFEYAPNTGIPPKQPDLAQQHDDDHHHYNVLEEVGTDCCGAPTAAELNQTPTSADTSEDTSPTVYDVARWLETNKLKRVNIQKIRNEYGDYVDWGFFGNRRRKNPAEIPLNPTAAASDNPSVTRTTGSSLSSTAAGYTEVAAPPPSTPTPSPSPLATPSHISFALS